MSDYGSADDDDAYEFDSEEYDVSRIRYARAKHMLTHPVRVAGTCSFEERERCGQVHQIRVLQSAPAQRTH